jgi:hypothetical protein
VAWYKAHHHRGADLQSLTRNQIATYTADATRAGLAWTQA